MTLIRLLNLQKVLETYDKEQEKYGKLLGTNVALVLGRIYNNLGQYDKSLLNHKKSMEIAEELNDKVEWLTDYRNIGLMYDGKGQYNDALTYHNKALKIHEELNDRRRNGYRLHQYWTCILR